MGGLGGIHIRTFQTKPNVITKKMNISLQLAYLGGSVPIEIERTINENNLQVSEVETIYVNIERGIDNDEIIILEGKGNILNNIKGDVKIIIKIDNTTEYERNGLDLRITRKITLKEALTGFQFVISHLNGINYTINNTRGNIISPIFCKQVQNMGMVRGSHVGNIIINFDIIFPTFLEESVLENLSQILP
jgi:DnaJ family protein A protein 2